MFISRSFPKPLFRKTAIGGKNIANIISTSLFIMFLSYSFCCVKLLVVSSTLQK
jgi:hypothetical protein